MELNDQAIGRLKESLTMEYQGGDFELPCGIDIDPTFSNRNDSES